MTTRGIIFLIGSFLSCLLLGLPGHAAMGSFFDWKQSTSTVELPQSAFTHRGFLIDMAGHKGRDESYFELVDQMALCGFNVLYLRLADDEGCAVELKSYPELSSSNAMSRSTLKKLIGRARRSGIQVIPVIEIWGRALWILKHHPELMDEMNPVGLKSGLGQSMTVQQEIIEEVAGLFGQSAYLHLGVGGVMPDSDAMLTPQAAAEAQRLIAHLNILCEIVRDQNKTPMLWTEQFEKHPEWLAQVKTPIQLIMDVDRYDNAAEVVDRFRAQGHSLIAASALVQSQSMMFPAEGDFEPQRKAAKLACDKHMAGLVTTYFKPQRMFPGTLSHALFFSGRLSCDSSSADEAEIMNRFASRYFATSDPDVGQAFLELCRIDNRLEAMDASYWRDRESFTARLTDEAVTTDNEFADRVNRISNLLEDSAGSIGDHKADFEAYRLLVDFLEYLARRRLLPSTGKALVDKARDAWAANSHDRAIADLEAVRESVKKLENERVKLIDRLVVHWAESRYVERQYKTGDFRENLLDWVTSDKTNSYGSYELYETLTKLITTAKEGGELVLTPPESRQGNR